jgi:hypothetical protein
MDLHRNCLAKSERGEIRLNDWQLKSLKKSISKNGKKIVEKQPIKKEYHYIGAVDYCAVAPVILYFHSQFQPCFRRAVYYYKLSSIIVERVFQLQTTGQTVYFVALSFIRQNRFI